VLRPTAVLLVAAALLLSAVPGSAVVPSAAAGPTTADGVPCSPGDLVETGVQGQVPLADQLDGRSRLGYACNLRLVGSNDLGGRGGDTQMTWFGSCAYRATTTDAGDAVAVLDVRDARRPRLVRLLQEAAWSGEGGILGIHEGLTVSEQRRLLAVPVGNGLWAYDVRDCRSPRLVGSFRFDSPSDPVKHDLPMGDFGIHSGKLSPDGTLYYATNIGNGATSFTGPCLTVIDLRDPRRMRLVTRWMADTPCHDLSLSPDGRTAYVGWYAATVGHPAAVVGAFTPTQAANEVSGLRVVDVSQVQAHRPAPRLTVLSEMTGGRQHTETVTRIKGRTYVIGAEEATCPGGNARIVDVTDSRRPVHVAELPLQINQLEHCGSFREDTDGAGNLLLYTSHYVSVDDPRDASLVFITWYSSGLRVFDVRDPRRPREVAYLNPAVGEASNVSHDSSTTYVRYLKGTGQVWFGSAVRGFNVAELAPRVRPAGSSGRWSVPAGHRVPAPRPVDLATLLSWRGSRWACTLG